MAGRLLRGGLVVVVASAVGLALSAGAWAGLATDVQRGERLANEIGSGTRSCSELSSDDFELVGEYAMSLYLGNTARHEAMNQHMAVMMGTAGEERMHQALGYRYTGCPGGPAAGWIGPMGGMMSGAFHGEQGNYGTGMMGGYRGGMMGFGGTGDGDVSVLGVVLIALAAAAVGGALVLAGRRISRSNS